MYIRHSFWATSQKSKISNICQMPIKKKLGSMIWNPVSGISNYKRTNLLAQRHPKCPVLSVDNISLWGDVRRGCTSKQKPILRVLGQGVWFLKCQFSRNLIWILGSHSRATSFPSCGEVGFCFPKDIHQSFLLFIALVWFNYDSRACGPKFPSNASITSQWAIKCCFEDRDPRIWGACKLEDIGIEVCSIQNQRLSLQFPPKDLSAPSTFRDKRPPQGNCIIKTFWKGLGGEQCEDICASDKTKEKLVQFISKASEILIFCGEFEMKTEFIPTLGIDLFGILIWKSKLRMLMCLREHWYFCTQDGDQS